MKRKIIRQILILTFIFTISIFLIGSYFAEKENNLYIEENFMEKQLEAKNTLIWSLKSLTWWLSIKEDKSVDSKKIFEDIIIEQRLEQDNKIEQEFKSAKEIEVIYILEGFEKRIDTKIKKVFYDFLRSSIFSQFYSNIEIYLEEDPKDIRWKMKNRIIRIYWVNQLTREEFISVFIHEFGHFIDLYYLKPFLKKDLSDKFYSISWNETKVIKKWLTVNDFVSGYAMTNKYEDFAETFTYFILHNNSFLEKIEKSKILEQKYEFITEEIFKKNDFLWENFSANKEDIDKYNRDTTKIDINLQKFLKYLKK